MLIREKEDQTRGPLSELHLYIHEQMSISILCTVRRTPGRHIDMHSVGYLFNRRNNIAYVLTVYMFIDNSAEFTLVLSMGTPLATVVGKMNFLDLCLNAKCNIFMISVQIILTRTFSLIRFVIVIVH